MKKLLGIIFFIKSFNIYSQSQTVVVTVDSISLKINNNTIEEGASMQCYNLNCFQSLLDEKPRKVKDRSMHKIQFCFMHSGCSVNYNLEDKKRTFPFEMVFLFNYNYHYVPSNKMEMFHGDFYFDGVKIDSTTTFSQFKNSRYKTNHGLLTFEHGYIVFESENPAAKIIEVEFSFFAKD